MERHRTLLHLVTEWSVSINYLSVVIVGGCSEGGMVLDDIQLLDYTKSTVNKVGILNINNDSVMVIPY